MSDNVGDSSKGGPDVSVPSTRPLAGKCSFLPAYDPSLDSKQLEWDLEDEPEGGLSAYVVTAVPPDTGQT